MSHNKPIDLRHPYIFYLGHLPAFMDIQLSRLLGEELSKPAYFATIFERGMDPIMEDPSQCHPHSATTDCWPEYADIISYRDKVHERCRKLIRSDNLSKRALRILNMCYEHDAMHLEV
jgi:L-histidine Nalpha-methyltransferase / hercynylcysteine S-oxide synthase